MNDSEKELTVAISNVTGEAPSTSLLSDELMPDAPAAVGPGTPNPMLTYAETVAPLPEAVAEAQKLPSSNDTSKTSASNDNGKSSTKRWTWKKPAGKPNRPLSAYNLFFADVRASLDESLSFVSLASHVAAKWQNIDETTKAEYEAKARIEKEKYQRDVGIWKANNNAAGDSPEQEDAEARPSKKQKSDCANCPVCLAKAQNNTMAFDGPYYIISCSKEFARQLANADIPGFQATFVADPAANLGETKETFSGEVDYAAAIEEALQASAEPALEKRAIDQLLLKLEEQRALAASRQQQQQMDQLLSAGQLNQVMQPSPDSQQQQDNHTYIATTELINEIAEEVTGTDRHESVAL